MDILMQSPQTVLVTRPVLAAGTTTTVSTTNAVTGWVNGVSYTAAALANTATPTTDLNTGAAFPPVAANQGTVILLGITAAGALRAMQGQVLALDVGGNFVLAPNQPAIPDNLLVFGRIVVKAGATAVGNWVFGTNNLSGVTGLTYSFADETGAMGRPQVA